VGCLKAAGRKTRYVQEKNFKHFLLIPWGLGEKGESKDRKVKWAKEAERGKEKDWSGEF